MKTWNCGAILEVNDFSETCTVDNHKKLEKGKSYRAIRIFSVSINEIKNDINDGNYRGYQFEIEYSRNRKGLFNPSNFRRGERYINDKINNNQIPNKNDGVFHKDWSYL